MERIYLEVIQHNSQGAESRELTPYTNEETAIRKFHEAFSVVGAGPIFVSAVLHDKYHNILPGFQSFWEKKAEPESTEG